MANPTTVAGLRAWWQADSITSPPADGSGLSSWTDSSGAGSAATQATVGKQPTYRASGAFLPNGKPCVEFTAANSTSLTAPSANSGPTTRFAVFRPKTVGFSQSLTTMYAGYELYPDPSGNLQVDVPGIAGLSISPAPGPVAVGTWCVLTIDSNGTNSHHTFFNGATGGTSTVAATPNATTIDIGARAWNVGDNAVDGYIAEIVDYSAVLSGADRAVVHTYLSDKYGLTVADYKIYESGQNTSAMAMMRG